jgi:radical SAM superfamily enzyme YgiQ (UPF0313 family)
MTQVNTPYPATAYLTGFLEEQGHEVQQADLSLELVLELLSKKGLTRVRDTLLQIKNRKPHDSVDFFLETFDDYLAVIEPVISFLQGKNPTLAFRLAQRSLVPEGPRFLPLRQHASEIESLFGSMGTQDFAKHIASLFIDDLADVLKAGIDPDFEFSRYAERLAYSQVSFTPLHIKLHGKINLIDQMLIEICKAWQSRIEASKLDILGISVPFSGNMYSALRIAKSFKEWRPDLKIVLGGGYVNTELRSLSDPRVFEYIDALTFDDGEVPLQQLLSYFAGHLQSEELVRTKILAGHKVQDINLDSATAGARKQLPFKKSKGPSYRQLPLSNYVSMIEMPNPMHRFWSDLHWNKMILAHGCYWKKCTFCDVHLDYIQRFEPAAATDLVDQMQKMIQETGHTGFHFVDEAAPPALLKALAHEILRRSMKVTWWGNLRFDKQFDESLCELLADSGCVAVTGGLEVASPRILELINKGVSIPQVARVAQNFSKAGILVHAYLMYGFPSQTLQETVDSLEVVRQLFEEGCLRSANWHQFIATAHSPVGKNPAKFAIELLPPPVPEEGIFSMYEIPFVDPTGLNHEALGQDLRKALYNFMHGLGLEQNVGSWFTKKVPKTTIEKSFIQKCLKEPL